MMSEAVEARLNAIEGELRRVADSLQLVLRLDERMVTLFKSRDDHETRLRVVEVATSGTSYTVTAWQKFGWIIAAAVTAFGLNFTKDYLAKPAVPPASFVQPQASTGKSGQTQADVH